MADPSSPGLSDDDRLRQLRERLAELRAKHEPRAPFPPSSSTTSRFDKFLQQAKGTVIPPTASDIGDLPPAHPRKVFFSHAFYSLIILGLAIALTSTSLLSDKNVVDIQGMYATEIDVCENETSSMERQLETLQGQLAIVSQQLADAEKEKAGLQAAQSSCISAEDITGMQAKLDEKQAAIDELKKQAEEQNSAELRSCEIEIRDVQKDANSLLAQLWTTAREKCVEAAIIDKLNTTDTLYAGFDKKVSLADYQFKIS